jgi:tellurite resistance protein TehA-like permease
MRVAMIWWFVAAVMVMFTFRYLYRSFRGKLTVDAPPDSGYGEH